MTSGSRTRVLVVFVKAPVPGRVKTRLAEGLGDEAAAEVYRQLGKRVVRQLGGGEYRLVIYYDPPDSEPSIRRWLGESAPLRYLPQPGGDLGRRLRHAFDWGFERADLVCVVGTDIPELDRSVVETAFSLLDDLGEHGVVVGPALDGGYYLLALSRPAPELFRAMPWSTDRVLEETMRRAHTLGLWVRSLTPLADVDRAEDLAPELRERWLGADSAGADEPGEEVDPGR